jgi:hypothetical protein
MYLLYILLELHCSVWWVFRDSPDGEFAVVLHMILKFVILVDFARNELFLDGFCLTSIGTSKTLKRLFHAPNVIHNDQCFSISQS